MDSKKWREDKTWKIVAVLHSRISVMRSSNRDFTEATDSYCEGEIGMHCDVTIVTVS